MISNKSQACRISIMNDKKLVDQKLPNWKHYIKYIYFFSLMCKKSKLSQLVSLFLW